MRLYPRREGTDSVDNGGVHYTPAADGGFDFPPDLTDLLHSAHVNKEPLWEDQIERQHRLMAEDAARRADPATHLAMSEKIAAASDRAAAAMEKLVQAAEATEPDEKAAARKTAAKAAA